MRARSSSSFASRSASRHRGVERQVERDLDDRDRDDAGAPLGREAARDVERLLRLAAGRERHEDVPVLERGRRPEHDRARARSRRAARADAAGTADRRRSRRRARRSPRSASAASLTTTTNHAMPVPRPPSTANSGQLTPRIRRFGRARHGSSASGFFTRSAITEACAIVNESIAPNAYIRRGSRPARRARRGSAARRRRR